MKKIVFALTVASAMTAVSVFAQTNTEVEVPSLTSVLEGLSPAEVSEIIVAAQANGAIDADIDAAISNVVSEAVAEGLISAEEAVHATASFEIVAANAEFFDFDILTEIGDAINSGDFSVEQIRQTLEGFNRLSNDGKALVGQHTFNTGSENPLYKQLNDADKNIVDNLPVLNPS